MHHGTHLQGEAFGDFLIPSPASEPSRAPRLTLDQPCLWQSLVTAPAEFDFQQVFVEMPGFARMAFGNQHV